MPNVTKHAVISTTHTDSHNIFRRNSIFRKPSILIQRSYTKQYEEQYATKLPTKVGVDNLITYHVRGAPQRNHRDVTRREPRANKANTIYTI